MQDYDHTHEQEHCLSDNVQELKKINIKIAQLSLRKEELTKNIICALEHNHEGQKSYDYGLWRIEIKTPFVYSLNKKRYESGEINLPSNFNPVKESISYSIDKRLCDQYMTDAPDDVRDALIELIDKKPGKAAVTIKERIL
jgi:hypothetical protein